MHHSLKRFKPGVAPRIHLACAAGLWTAIGFFLVLRAIMLLKSSDNMWLIGAGVILGSLKSLLILDRSSRKGVERIKRFADNTCIGAVYSWKTWLLVLTMMFFGMLVRHLQVSPLIVGTVLAAVGWALIFSSRHAWAAWANWNR